MSAKKHLAGAPRKKLLGQGQVSQRAHEGHLRAAEALKKKTDARQFMKAVQIHELDPSFPLLPQNYEYKPKKPMDQNSGTYKARQRENWSYTASRYYEKLGLGSSSFISPPPTLGKSRGITSSWGAKRKPSHRRRGGL